VLAPVVVGGLHRGDGWGGVVLAACLLLLGLRQGVLPVALPGAVLALSLVEAARSFLIASAFPPALLSVAPLVLAGVGAAACASVPAPPRWAGLVLVVSGLLVGAATPSSDERGEDTQGWLMHLADEPRAHPAALRLAERYGVALPLSAGWSPHGALLTPAQRIEAARWLDTRGRGGEGRRLLGEDRGVPRVAWWWLLARRVEGLPEVEGLRTTPPPEALVLPGSHELSLSMLANGSKDVLVHVSAPCTLMVDAHGDAWHGAAELEVRVDRQAAARFRLGPTAAGLVLSRPGTGPHRVRFRFDNDLSGAGGDRNVYVTRLACAAPVAD